MRVAAKRRVLPVVVMIGLIGLPAVTGTVWAAAATEESGRQMEKPGTFIHIVYFWLKPGTDEAARKQLVNDCKEYLGAISTVRYIAVGLPAGTPRTVVDSSYGVGLMVHFDDKAGHDLYQSDQKHVEFIERNQDHWEKVQVYDTIAE